MPFQSENDAPESARTGSMRATPLLPPPARYTRRTVVATLFVGAFMTQNTLLSSPPRSNASATAASWPEHRGDVISRVKIFYNLFVRGPEDERRVTSMLLEQLRALDPALHDANVSIAAIGHRPSWARSGDGAAFDVTHRATGTEGASLRALWDHCRAAEARRHHHHDDDDDDDARVVYLHSKGSLTPGEDNDRLRRFLTEGALSRECASLPDACDVCSSRMSSHPHPHTSGERGGGARLAVAAVAASSSSRARARGRKKKLTTSSTGNMWLARCRYVARLVDPDALARGELPGEFRADRACKGYGRYFFESWVYTHPSVRPCDLYPVSPRIALG